MLILGIETSCDETSAAVVEDGRKVLSNVVSSSLSFHQKTGGVIPEIAAREQIKAIIPVLETALSEASIKPKELDALAVTIGPGLIGSLLVGVETAKTLSFVWEKPLIPINHLWGHVYTNWLQTANSRLTAINFPLIALVVSGGHSDLVIMNNHTSYKWLGGTLDDAAGEAFDKIARFLGLGYPGGPAIEKAAKKGNLKSFGLPRPLIEAKNFDFSFSGLKTAVIREFERNPKLKKNNLAASFQQAAVDVLVKKTVRAAQKFGAKEIVVGGGVAANSSLRLQLTAGGKKIGIPVRFAPLEFCGDNGAMIASAAFFNFKPKPISQIQANPSLHF